MEPFKDELKLIGSWAEKCRNYGSLFLILMSHSRLSLRLASADTKYMVLSLSHEPDTYVPYVGSVGEPDCRQQLILVSASSFSAPSRSNYLKSLNLHLWSGVIRDLIYEFGPREKCQVWEATNAMKKYVGINMIYCNKVFMNGQSHKKGIQCIGQYPTKITDMESIRTVNWFQLHLGGEFSEYQTWKDDFWWRVRLRTIMKPSSLLKKDQVP